MFDKNKSGSLDYSQVMGFVNKYFLDHNNSMRITLEQATAIAKRFDKNGDGTVGRDEIAGLVKEVRDKHYGSLAH